VRTPDLPSGFFFVLLLSLGGCLQPGPLARVPLPGESPSEEGVPGDYATDLARLRWKSFHELPPGTYLQSTVKDEGDEWSISFQLMGEGGVTLEPHLAEYLVEKRTGKVKIAQDYARLIARRDPEAGALLKEHPNASILFHFLEGEGMASPNQTYWEILIIEGREKVANILIDADRETVKRVRKQRVITFGEEGD